MEKKEEVKQEEKKEEAKPEKSINFALVTVSSTRTQDNDKCGSLIKELVEKAGHFVEKYVLVIDDKRLIYKLIKNIIKESKAQVIITNGGIGLTKKDYTPEAVKQFFEKELPQFNLLATQLSYEEVGAHALTYRFCSGIVKEKLIFSLPGNEKVCQKIMENLILPDIKTLLDTIKEEKKAGGLFKR